MKNGIKRNGKKHTRMLGTKKKQKKVSFKVILENKIDRRQSF